VYYYVEPMGEHDIERVQVIERQSFHTHWSAKTYRDELRKPATSRYLVAKASSAPPPPRHDAPPERRSILQFFPTLLPTLFAPPAPPVRQSQGQIVGYGGLWLVVDEAHITTIAVDPAHRGRSVGELLLISLIDQAYELSATWVTLEVRKSNTTAQNLYMKYGFRTTGVRDRYYTDNGEDALIMWTDKIAEPEFQARLRMLRQRLYDKLQAQAAR
jgi:[ribosomal protein S18]-alanine N-acetyltransferase